MVLHKIALSKDPDEAEALAKRLGNVLEGAWSATTGTRQLISLPSLIAFNQGVQHYLR